jgi:hypothetical protein
MMRILVACLLLLGLANPAYAEWHVASSRHFVVYSDDDPKDVLAFTTKLERFDSAFRTFRVFEEDPRGDASRVTIFLVKDIAAIQKLYGGSSGVAGFYQARASGSVAFVPRTTGEGSAYGFTPLAVFLHEYTHHLMLTNWTEAALPQWFVEGFADFHATAMLRDDGSVIFGALPRYRAFNVDKASVLPMKMLLRPYNENLTSEQRDILYGRGSLLVHYLTFDPVRRAQLAKYIGEINAGKPIETAAAALGDVSKLDLTLNSYGKRPFLPSYTVQGADVAVPKINMRALGAGEAASMPILIRSSRGVDKKSAPIVAALARTVTAPFPNDAAAQNALAEAEFDAEQFGAAEAAADRALAADPKSIHAMLYKGMAQMAVAKKAGVKDAATWQGIRRWFLNANKVNPEDPQPLILFYESFAAAKEPPSKNAEGGMLYAYKLAPYDLGLRINTARILIQQGEARAAQAAIGPVAFNIHAGPGENYPLKMLTALQANDIPGAQAIMKAAQEKDQADAKKAEDGKDKKKGK